MKKLRQKKGVVLIYFILIVFGVFAILSLLIDIGLARVTQVQMQTAVDGASLLGLKHQDNALFTEQEKRQFVRDQVSSVFDDDFDFNNDEYNLGAGPVIPLVGGQTALNALQTIDVANLSVYDPDLQLNDQDNEVHGDMVRGEYFLNQSHVENADYTRDDFDPDAIDPNAFLVRMRRANGNLDNVLDVSSSGSTIPYLFGQATTMQAVGDGVGPRFEGITVRATAVSSVSTVKGVGVSQGGSLGVSPYALQKGFWNTLVLDTPTSVFVDGNGNIFAEDTLVTNIGKMLVADVSELQPLFIGDLLSNQSSTIFASDGYVPVFDNFSSEDLVVGFGRSSMSFVQDLGTSNEVLVTKFSGQVAFENATALLSQGLVNVQVLPQLLTEGEEALLAPVLVR